MSWVTVGIAAAGAIKGGMDASAARKQQKKHDAFRKASIMYSPWSGLGDPGYVSAGNTDTMSGMLGGATQGLMIGSMGQQAGLWGGGGGAASAGALGGSGSQSMLGGDAMAAKLGAQGDAAMASMPMAQSPQMMGTSPSVNPAANWSAQMPQLQMPQSALTANTQQQQAFMLNPNKQLLGMSGLGGNGQYGM